MELWNGTKWSIVLSPTRPRVDTVIFMQGVSCRTSGDCFAVGEYYGGYGEYTQIDALGRINLGNGSERERKLDWCSEQRTVWYLMHDRHRMHRGRELRR